MLPLSDRTRRRITLALFAALCVAPTLIVAAWGISRHLPWHVSGEARRLSWQLGMKVSLDAVHHPRPGTVRYEGLVLANPETGQPVARCRILEATWGTASDGQKPGAPLLTLVATRPEIEAGALDEVRRLVERVLMGRAGPLDAEVRLTAESLALQSGRGEQTFSDVIGTIQTLPEGTLAKVDFRLPGRSMPKPAFVYLGRYRRQATPVSVLGLDTGQGGLPCPVLAVAADWAAALGPQSRFLGAIDARETADGWEVALCGQLDGVELGRLVGHRLPSPEISGTAQVRVDRAVVLDGRLQQAGGTLIAGPGEVSTGLLDAAIRCLGLSGSPDVRSADRPMAYEQLAVAFSMDGDGLRLRGRCDAGGRGTILAGRQGPILAERAGQPIPVVDLVEVLAPGLSSAGSGRSSESANLLAKWLLRRMPLPDSTRLAAPGDSAAQAEASRHRDLYPR